MTGAPRDWESTIAPIVAVTALLVPFSGVIRIWLPTVQRLVVAAAFWTAMAPVARVSSEPATTFTFRLRPKAAAGRPTTTTASSADGVVPARVTRARPFLATSAAETERRELIPRMAPSGPFWGAG